MIKINNVNVGFPAKVANVIKITVFSFETKTSTVNTYWELFNLSVYKFTDSENVDVDELVYEPLAVGTYELTESEYSSWGANNNIVENAVLKSLSLTRL